jgi:hypothetical protein
MDAAPAILNNWLMSDFRAFRAAFYELVEAFGLQQPWS